MTELSLMWLGSLMTIWVYGQIAALSGWMMLHYQSIATRRERRDTTLAFMVGVAFVIVQLLWSIRGLVQCQGIVLEMISDSIALGAGLCIKSSLEKRYSFYLFAQQEDRKRAQISPQT